MYICISIITDSKTLTADIQRFGFLTFADRIMNFALNDRIVVFATDVV